MVDWLTDWDEDIPPTVRDHANAGHDIGGMDTADMPGMMGDDQTKALEDAPDGDFENVWLTMMFKHHEGAVEMARIEISDGIYGPAIDTAQQIVAAQQDEIETMYGMVS